MSERLLPAVLLDQGRRAGHAQGSRAERHVGRRPHTSRRTQCTSGSPSHSAEAGLIAPAIHDADQKSLDELEHDLRDLVTRTRSGRLRSSEMSDPTITVTNLGEQGVASVYGVIYPPQVALVGFGKITDRPWAQDGMIGIRPVISMTLAADHRASDGHTGARFLNAIDHLLQDPGSL